MFRILESQAPAKQTATDTISTLSGRLQSATLLEDRRAAILGLRSFAKLFPASVASGALRNLINSLGSDGDDVETSKVVLETLLMLFNPDASSPEASDDIALWLADEFTQVGSISTFPTTSINLLHKRQDNVTILLDLLNHHDFFSRLYSLQLISAILSARPERTQECVYTAPLGISRLVSVLDDKREAIRSEGLLLLVALTPLSQELQKVVAFENVFDRIFDIIESEGSLSDGGIIVQDCLSLLANLLRLNVSNQSFFRETGGVQKVANVLRQALRDAELPNSISTWTALQRDKNIWGFLSIIRLFLGGGSVSTQLNQNSFWQNGVVFTIMEIAFDASLATAIRSEAFLACADLIRANNSLQENFAQRDVITQFDLEKPQPAQSPKPNGPIRNSREPRMNVIQGLLETALAVSTQPNFDIRLAACECIKAYLYGHVPIRLHFLRRARDGHSAENPESDNIITILLQNPSDQPSSDPYRPWIAAVILFNLTFEDHKAKSIATEIVEGDAGKGEETVTFIQALSGNMISQAQRGTDDRVTIGYLMVLIGWTFEDPDAVNDFLQEGTNVQSLIQMALQPVQHKVLETGLCAFLLGVLYEFSSKDSPISRSTLHDIVTTRLGREHYNDKLTKLREHPIVRDFEVLPQSQSGDQVIGLPDVYFDKIFVDFLKDNFSRVARAIDRPPSIEVSVVANGVEKGISRELVDSLRLQLDDKMKNLQRAESQILTLERRLGQEQADHRKVRESTALEFGRIKNINENLQRNHDEETLQLREDHRRTFEQARREHDVALSTLQLKIGESEEEYESMSAKVRAGHQAEVDQLKIMVENLGRQKEKAAKNHAQDLSTANEEYKSSNQLLESRLQRAEEKFMEAESRATKAEARATYAETITRTREDARAKVQTEIDDLLMVLGDLEEKRAVDKSRLKALGEDVSDIEVADDGEDATSEVGSVETGNMSENNRDNLD